MAGLNRKSTGVYLPAEVATEIIADAQQASTVQALARKVELPGSGISINVVTGDAEAQWVAETATKPQSSQSVEQKVMTPYKLAFTQLYSDEFARDLPTLYSALASRLPGALAKKFDETVLHGTAPGSGFDTLTGATAIDLSTNPFDAFVDAMEDVDQAGGDLNGIALSGSGKAAILRAKNSNGDPLFISDLQNQGQIGSVLGVPAYASKAARDEATKTVAVAGDWNSALWGQVGEVRIDLFTEYAGGVALADTNQFAIRCEVEYAFITAKADRFVRFTNGTAGE